MSPYDAWKLTPPDFEDVDAEPCPECGGGDQIKACVVCNGTGAIEWGGCDDDCDD